MERPKSLYEVSFQRRVDIFKKELAKLSNVRRFKPGTLLPSDEYLFHSHRIEALRAEINRKRRMLQSAS